MFMLDTDICSYIIKERSVSILETFYTLDAKEVSISTITQAELLYGVVRATKKQIKKVRYEAVNRFLAMIPMLPWDGAAAEAYAGLRVMLERQGKQIGAMDMLIAAHALSIGATLVTNNIRHFSVVPHLKLANWA